MPVTSDKPAPYAPARLVTEIITRYRNMGLPSPIDDAVLKRVGVTDSLMRRTAQTLQILDLVDEKCVPTAVLESLKAAPQAEYKGRVAQWLNAAYADVLKFVDPGAADETKVTDAFRTYEPAGMRDRMVSLFMALYAFAGVGQERSRSRSKRASNANTAAAPKRAPRKADTDIPPNPTSANDSTKSGDKQDTSIKGEQTSSAVGRSRAFEQLLLEKFPAFDPVWDDSLKAQWFAGFEKFMALMSPK